ncbi:hypothetical protein IFT87_13475 [Sphingomonas sp. CFBP 8765]|nr:hypothetical protein [Sphingomonas sp. CFBP 8765]
MMKEIMGSAGRIAWGVVKFAFSPFIVAIVSYGVGSEYGYHRGSEAMKTAIFGVLDKMADMPEPAATPGTSA